MNALGISGGLPHRGRYWAEHTGQRAIWSFPYALVSCAYHQPGSPPFRAARRPPRARVVELFTSPNCSSCPPADELFVELARNPDLITLVMPVDSWDRPGRKDALAKPSFTDRQAAYADVRNKDSLYTPQAMINGAAPAMGADPAEIEDAIAQTAGVLSVLVKAAPVGSDIVVSVGAAKRGIDRRDDNGAAVHDLAQIPLRGGENITLCQPRARHRGDREAGAESRSGKPSAAGDDGALRWHCSAAAGGHAGSGPGAILGAARIPIRCQGLKSRPLEGACPRRQPAPLAPARAARPAPAPRGSASGPAA